MNSGHKKAPTTKPRKIDPKKAGRHPSLGKGTHTERQTLLGDLHKLSRIIRKFESEAAVTAGPGDSGQLKRACKCDRGLVFATNSPPGPPFANVVTWSKYCLEFDIGSRRSLFFGSRFLGLEFLHQPSKQLQWMCPREFTHSGLADRISWKADNN